MTERGGGDRRETESFPVRPHPQAPPTNLRVLVSQKRYEVLEHVGAGELGGADLSHHSDQVYRLLGPTCLLLLLRSGLAEGGFTQLAHTLLHQDTHTPADRHRAAEMKQHPLLVDTNQWEGLLSSGMSIRAL